MLESFLVWQLAAGNVKDYFDLLHSRTLLEIQEALAMKKTMQYMLDEEDFGDYDNDRPPGL